jgi:Fic family protein
MNLQTSSALLQISRRLQTATAGLSLSDLEKALPKIPRRTLQRVVAVAMKEARLLSTGAGKATRYHLASSTIDILASKHPKPKTKTPPLQMKWSAAAQKSIDYILQPLQERKSVGYQQSLLEAYVPNQTSYLSPESCASLEAMGRAHHGTNKPEVAATVAKNVLTRLLVDLSWASSQLEGNTYSLLDTQRLVQFGQLRRGQDGQGDQDGKNAKEAQMILNHKTAIEYLVLPERPHYLSVQTVCDLHALLSDGLLENPMDGGRIRTGIVGIGQSSYHPLALPPQLERLLGEIVRTANEIKSPIEQALFLMVHLPYLQPFIDVNKRTSRLAANVPLIIANLCPISFLGVERDAYVQAVLCIYEQVDPTPMMELFVAAYTRSCYEYVAVEHHLIEPDPLRTKYRKELTVVMCQIVRAQAVSIPDNLPVQDQAAFEAIVQHELAHLTTGNAIRFGLRPLEVEAWRSQCMSEPIPVSVLQVLPLK